MACFLKLFALLVLPVWMLDGCLHRDPLFYLDEKSQLIAPWSSAPLSFSYRDRERPNSEWYQLHEVTSFLIGDSVFTGKTGNQFFIVRRADGHYDLYSTEAERDGALSRTYSTTISKTKPLPWWSRHRANLFFPYNLLYYFGTTALILIFCVWRSRKRSAAIKEAKVTE